MREFDFDILKILVAQQRGKFYAIGAKCTYMDMALVGGSLGNKRVRCPLCGSCFSFMTGDVEDFPALNPLPCYKVDVEDGMVYVSIQQRDLMYSSRYSRLVIPTPSYKTDETFVVIGGGPAAAMCLEYLRRFGFTGRLLAFMKDAELPYDRTRLNDNLAVDVNTILLRNQEFYDQMRAEVFLSTSVVHMSAKDKTLVRSDGGVTSFDKVFIATGCEAKRLSQDVPGAMDAIGMFYLRTPSDANAIHAALNEDIDLVVVGSSYLAMEMADSCLPHVNSLTMISRSVYPFHKVFGQVLGRRILNFYKDKGIIMRTSVKVVKVEMNPDTLAMTGIILSDDSIIRTQMVIVCVGDTFATRFLKGSGVEMTPEGAVPVDQYLTTNIPYVYAGGDIAYAPLHPYFNTTTTGSHYQIAQVHGKTAASNMLGKPEPLKTIPFINVSLGEINLQYAGWIKNVDNVEIIGSLNEMKFAAYYMVGDKATGIVTCRLPGLASKFAESIHMEKYVQRHALHDHAWSQHLFTCDVHDRDMDYDLDLDKLREMGLVF
ncbi:hypothetical protein M8J75_003288 [Diaphorina citri]|nr:hypothetical protein M8J75_003288 [Diaphorina citri]